MLKSYLFRVGLAAVTALALVGCGGDPSPADTNETPSAEEMPAESTTPAEEAPEVTEPDETAPAPEEAAPAVKEAEAMPKEEAPAPKEAAPAPKEAAPAPKEAAPAPEEAEPAPKEASAEVTPPADVPDAPSATFYLSAIPDEKITDQKAKFDKLADYLSAKLNVPVEFVFSKDYADSVTKFKNGEVHLVWFGGLSGVQARMAVPGAEAIAQGKADPEYKSYFIANKDAGIEPSDEFPMAIKDKTFTFGSPGSTSGRLMPQYFILQNNGGTPIDEWFAEKPMFQMSGGHVATANAVADGTVETGALNYKTYDSLVAEDPKIAENTVKIWTTPNYADYNFTIHPDVKIAFGEDFIEKVQAALIAAPVGSDALKAINRESIIAAKSEDFDGIKETAIEVGLIEE